MKSAQFFPACVFSLLLVVNLLFPGQSVAQQIWETNVLKTGISARSIGSRSLALDAMGYPHVVSTSDNLHYTWFDGTKWNSEPILPLGITGSSAQIAISPDGTVHCVFYCEGDLVHTWKSELGWEFDMPPDVYSGSSGSIRIDSNGRLHFVYFTNRETLIHAVWTNRVWTREDIDPITDYTPGLKFDLDSMNQLHLCFYRDGKIIHLFSRNSVWIEETVMENVSGNSNVQLRIDRSDNAHISYHRYKSSSSDEALYYLHQQSGTWHETVMGDDDYDGLNMFLDNVDRPHFAFISDGTLMHIWATGNGWERETVDSTDKYDSGFSGISGDDGLTHILVRNKTQSFLSYLKKFQTGWDQQVLSSWGYYSNSSLAVDQNGNMHVLFTGFNGNQLEYGYLKNGNWNFEVLDNGMGNESGECCIAPDRSGDVHISYYNARRRTVFYAKKIGSEWRREVILEGESALDSKMIVTDQGRVYILIATDNHLLLFRKYTDVWEMDAFEPGEYRSVSLFMDSFEKLHLSYFRALEGSSYERFRLYYRYMYEGVWREELVSSQGDVSGEGMVKVMTSSAGIPLIGYVQIHQGTHSTYSYSMHGFRDEEGWHVDKIESGSMKAWDLDVRGNPCFLLYNAIMFQSDDGEQMRSTFLYDSFSDSFIFDSANRIHLTARKQPDLLYMKQKLPVQGVRLEMPAHSFSPISTRPYLNTYLRSDGLPLHQAPLCILLECQHNYWFWPDWSGQFNVEYVDVNEKGSALLAIPSFSYREPLPQPLEGLTFWGALLNDDMTEIIGGVDGIGKWEFSIQ